MVAFKLATTLAVASFVFVACNDDPSPETACNEAVSAICDKLQECASFVFRASFFDRNQCIARTKINCTDSISAPGSKQTPARIEQCAKDTRGLSCADALGRAPPASCSDVAGTLADGSVCGLSSQCQNRLCRIPPGSTCGACSAIGAPGAFCEQEADCDRGLTCADKKCIAYGQVGAACTGNQPCNPTLACVRGTCMAPLRAGSQCEFRPLENPCDLVNGLYCQPGRNVCANIATVAPGNSCEFGSETIVACTAGECKRAPGESRGTCESYRSDGASCGEDEGTKCLTPARCTNGICTIPNPAMCR